MTEIDRVEDLTSDFASEAYQKAMENFKQINRNLNTMLYRNKNNEELKARITNVLNAMTIQERLAAEENARNIQLRDATFLEGLEEFIAGDKK